MGLEITCQSKKFTCKERLITLNNITRQLNVDIPVTYEIVDMGSSGFQTTARIKTMGLTAYGINNKEALSRLNEMFDDAIKTRPFKKRLTQWLMDGELNIKWEE